LLLVTKNDILDVSRKRIMSDNKTSQAKLIEAIENYDEVVDENNQDSEYLDEDFFETLYSRELNTEINLEGLESPLILIDYHGGDGDGSTMWVILQFEDKLWRISGYYSSWDSNEWQLDSLEEVKVKQVIRNIYLSEFEEKQGDFK
jgi:hypothetical protein